MFTRLLVETKLWSQELCSKHFFLYLFVAGTTNAPWENKHLFTNTLLLRCTLYTSYRSLCLLHLLLVRISAIISLFDSIFYFYPSKKFASRQIDVEAGGFLVHRRRRTGLKCLCEKTLCRINLFIRIEFLSKSSFDVDETFGKSFLRKLILVG